MASCRVENFPIGMQLVQTKKYVCVGDVTFSLYNDCQLVMCLLLEAYCSMARAILLSFVMQF